MTESAEHQDLVKRLERAAVALLPRDLAVPLWLDGQPSAGRPWAIEGFRPDLYARHGDLELVGEAKPPWDLRTRRTSTQLYAFSKYTASRSYCHLLLSVHWTTSALAVSLLRAAAAEHWKAVRRRAYIVDGVRPLELYQSTQAAAGSRT